jgi:hypothetical protein
MTVREILLAWQEANVIDLTCDDCPGRFYLLGRKPM